MFPALWTLFASAGPPNTARAHAVRPEHLGMRAIPVLKPARTAAKLAMRQGATGAGVWAIAGCTMLPSTGYLTTHRHNGMKVSPYTTLVHIQC